MKTYRCDVFLRDGVTRASKSMLFPFAGPSQAAKFAAEWADQHCPGVVHVTDARTGERWVFDVWLEYTAHVKWRRDA